MTVKYEYKSACCGHEYIEQRGAEEPQWFTTCNVCGNADYELIKTTVLAPNIELNPGTTAPTAPTAPTE
jgi:hypothetical protein